MKSKPREKKTDGPLHCSAGIDILGRDVVLGGVGGGILNRVEVQWP
jgi:hypothetical protein